MTVILVEPKEVNLRQLEAELGVEGLNVGTMGGLMLVEADVSAQALLEAVAAHDPDPAYVHPGDAHRAAQAIEALAMAQALKASARAKLKTGKPLTDAELDIILGPE